MMASSYADQRAMVRNEVLLEQPPTCPRCSGDIDSDGHRVFCPNPDCGWMVETREVDS
jgi:tRNA(Ile2) C34 agmatinyltransferase TiaS